MNMATKEKIQKKGFASFYKSGTGKYAPEEVSSQSKKPVSRNWLLRKPSSKPCQEMEQNGGGRMVVGGGGGGGGDGGDRVGELIESRKSVSHLESNLKSVAGFLQVKVLVSDMPGFMQVHAFRCARRTFDSLDKFSSKHVAYNLKKEFDKVYGPAWHCIVGSSFGSFVTHSTGGFLYFSMDNQFILIFKTKIQKSIS